MLDDLFASVLGDGARANRWQRRLHDEFVAGRIPEVVKVPTGGGKTAVMLVFLAALAGQAKRGLVTLPRRLVMVVNRRALVDQATSLAEALQRACRDGRMGSFTKLLSSLSASRRPLAVSTLRGELADNGEWSLDPTTPAIILGTPDMIGSRLLFRGYGCGKVQRAQQAGLLGVDTLIIHDEAHLSPVFSALLREIAAQAALSADRVGRPPLAVLEMTATTDHPEVFDGTPKEDEALDRDLLCRLRSRKTLRRHKIAGSPQYELTGKRPAAMQSRWEASQREKAAHQIAEIAARQRNSKEAIAVFLDRPDHVGIVANRLRKEGIAANRIAVLTGTMRIHERDMVARSDTFVRFLKGLPGDETVYLICTSAGEIGLDIDAHRIICDLVTVDRLIQRFGRGNRRGLRPDCIIDLVEWESTDPRQEATRQLLSSLPHRGSDASPLALSQLMSDRSTYRKAVPAEPRRRRLEGPILEIWAMTSLPINEPSQPPTLRIPEPDSFIHGLDERDIDVQLVWRQLPESRHAEWLEAWPIRRREVATLPIGSVTRLLAGLVSAQDRKALLISTDGESVEETTTDRLVGQVRPGMTLVLPVGLGGLDEFGLPIPMDAGSRKVEDVSGEDGGRIVNLERFEREDSGTAWRVIGSTLEAPTLEAAVAMLTEEYQAAVAFSDPDISRPPDERIEDWNRVTLWLRPKETRLAEPGDAASVTGCERGLDEHLGLAARAADRIARLLPLSHELSRAVVEASRLHDLGKAERRWQEAIGNTDPERPLAKRRTPHFDQRRNDGYRHELGSLSRANTEDELTRHLIAAHHGWARPLFRDRAIRKRGCCEPGQAAMAQFARLQSQYGLWGLAYLEALVRCADVLAELLADQLKGEGDAD